MATKIDVSLRVRILLLLWDGELRRGELFKRLRKKGEKSELYQSMLNQLVSDGAISMSTERYPVVTLLDAGRSLLRNDLLNDDFEFESPLGLRLVNLLLSVVRATIENVPATVSDSGHTGNTKITSYDEFKAVALETFDSLNRDYNLDNLVPIYRLRREIGDRVSRSQFNEWLMEMQAQDSLQLIGGEMPSITPDIAQDSITTSLGAARYYMKRL